MAAVAELRPVTSHAGIPNAPYASASPEFDLLVACCAEPSRERADRIRQILAAPLNWQRMLSLLDHHRVVPQVFGELSRFSHAVPGPILAGLRQRYRDNARKALWFTGELVRVLDHLGSAGVQALPYKGPLLAESLYGDITQRQFGDLDLLIVSADVPRAKIALRDLRYKLGEDLAFVEERPYLEQRYIESGCEYSFDTPHAPNLLELQWRIVPRFYCAEFDIAGFFSRADEVIVGGRRMRTLCARDLLLSLCVHAAKHVWVQLSWLCDIAQLAKSPEIDWNAIQDEAAHLAIQRIVSLNLLLAQKLLGSTLPPVIERYLRKDPLTTILAGEILGVIEHSVRYDSESIAYFRLMMRIRERWQDRAHFLWRLAVTPAAGEWSTVTLPKPMLPLYRLVRLSRVARRLASAKQV